MVPSAPSTSVRKLRPPHSEGREDAAKGALTEADDDVRPDELDLPPQIASAVSKPGILHLALKSTLRLQAQDCVREEDHVLPCRVTRTTYRNCQHVEQVFERMPQRYDDAQLAIQLWADGPPSPGACSRRAEVVPGLRSSMASAADM